MADSPRHHASDPPSNPAGEHPWLATVPAPALILLAITTMQLGASVAKQLFPALGADGTVAVRVVVSAALLWLLYRRRIRFFGQAMRQHWRILTLFGLAIASMNFFFYQALARIPLGAAVAIEFVGPLGLAALTSRRASHFAWVGLAALGIFLLSPLSGVQLDTVGIGFALLAGLFWAVFAGMAGKVSRLVSGHDGLVLGMSVGAVALLPLGLPIVETLAADPALLAAGIGVALLSTTVPFLLEFEALKRIPARTYGVLVSVEPAVATLIGFVWLNEHLNLQSMVAIACVVIAAVGISWSDTRTG
jgi:inner membrane transporter RhtA